MPAGGPLLVEIVTQELSGRLDICRWGFTAMG